MDFFMTLNTDYMGFCMISLLSYSKPVIPDLIDVLYDSSEIIQKSV